MMGLPVKTVPGKIVVWQAVVTLVCAVPWAILVGATAGLGALMGGGISVVLSLYFAIKMFSVDAASDPRGAVSAFFRAEALKLVLAAVIFSLVAKFLAHLFLPLISTFIATLAVYWFALIFTRLDPAGFGR
jgi:ATP synthase protein I